MKIFLLVLICSVFVHSEAKEVKATSITQTFGENSEEVNLLLRIENWFWDPVAAAIKFSAGESLFGRQFDWEFLIVNMFGVQSFNIIEDNEIEYPGRYIEGTVTLLDCNGNPVKDYPTGVIHEKMFLFGTFDNDLVDVIYANLVDANVCEFSYVRFSANFRIYNNATYIHATKGLISNEPHVHSTTLSWDNPITIMEKISTGKELWGKDATWQFSMKADRFFEMQCLGTTFSPAFGGGGFKIYTLEDEGNPEFWYMNIALAPYDSGTKKTWNLTLGMDGYTITKIELFWEAFGESAIMGDYLPPTHDYPRKFLI